MAIERQAEMLRRILESERIDLHTGTPGRFKNYDREKQTADVELQLKRIIPVGDEDEPDEVESYPILPSVPVVFPRGAGFYITWPIQDGDGCWVAFAESDMSQWLETGQVSDPGVAHRHALSSAVAFPGIEHNGNRLTDVDSEMGLRVGSQGGQRIEIKSDQILLGSSASQAAVKGDTQKDALSTFLDALQTWATAVETGVLAGGGSVAPPAPANFTAAIAQLKVDLTNALSDVVTLE